ncbi:MAG: hypothetical protein ACODAU_03900 [Myxococcota bacterium]
MIVRAVMACVLAGGVLAAVVPSASAQDRARGRDEAAAPSGSDDSGATGDVEAEEEVVEEGETKSKVVRFSGLDISGELKSPQLLYFLNRLRAEFDRPRLPHRSFMPELVESTRKKAF